MSSHRVTEDAGPSYVLRNGAGGGATRQCGVTAGIGRGGQSDCGRLRSHAGRSTGQTVRPRLAPVPRIPLRTAYPGEREHRSD